VEKHLLEEPFRARPHWGKNNRLNAAKVETCYNSYKLNKWKQVLKVFNKAGSFNNRFTNNVGFDVIDQEPKI